MSWPVWLVFLASNSADLPQVSPASRPIEMTIKAKTENDARWCGEPTFDATVKTSSPVPVWLDIGGTDTELVVTGYSIEYRTRRTASWQGARIGMSDDWDSIEYPRSPNATMLKGGDSATRRIRLKRAHLRAGRAAVEVRVRIHGTQDPRRQCSDLRGDRRADPDSAPEWSLPRSRTVSSH